MRTRRDAGPNPALARIELTDCAKQPVLGRADVRAQRRDLVFELLDGPETVLHVESAPAEALRELRAIPDHEGSLTILRAAGTLVYDGIAPHLAHPLLVYAEMVISPDPRMREAAQEVRDRFLSENV